MYIYNMCMCIYNYVHYIIYIYTYIFCMYIYIYRVNVFSVDFPNGQSTNQYFFKKKKTHIFTSPGNMSKAWRRTTTSVFVSFSSSIDWPKEAWKIQRSKHGRTSGCSSCGFSTSTTITIAVKNHGNYPNFGELLPWWYQWYQYVNLTCPNFTPK